MNPNKNNWKYYLNGLKSETCWCGRTKRVKQSFCRTCFRALPSDYQRALYQRIGNGYELAYDAAVALLAFYQCESTADPSSREASPRRVPRRRTRTVKQGG